MDCKNCKEEMEEEEQGNEDGMLYLIRKCLECGWSSKSWYDLDECFPSHTAWLDADKKEV